MKKLLQKNVFQTVRRFPRDIFINVLDAVLITQSELHVQYILASWISVSSDVKPQMESCFRSPFSHGWSAEKILLHLVLLKASNLIKYEE